MFTVANNTIMFCGANSKHDKRKNTLTENRQTIQINASSTLSSFASGGRREGDDADSILPRACLTLATQETQSVRPDPLQEYARVDREPQVAHGVREHCDQGKHLTKSRTK